MTYNKLMEETLGIYGLNEGLDYSELHSMASQIRSCANIPNTNTRLAYAMADEIESGGGIVATQNFLAQADAVLAKMEQTPSMAMYIPKYRKLRSITSDYLSEKED